MKITMAGFAGEIPKVIPRLLNESYAQRAVNTKLEDGSLTPVRQGRLDHQMSSGVINYIYRIKDQWVYWEKVVSVANAPVNENILYVTGTGAPVKYDYSSGVLEIVGLALPRPSSAPGVEVLEQPDPDTSTRVVYAYTQVTKWGEESEPSVTDSVDWSEGTRVLLRGFVSPTPNRGVTRQRFYRSQTSALGTTTLNFIAEREYSTADFIDEGFSVVEPITSTDYNPPPLNLSGIKGGPNGMMAAFVGKRLYFSEPYIPHAWPEKYILTTDYEIVGLGWFGSSLAVMTTGVPYVVTGTAPENMTMEKLELNLPCINARGIVDLGYTIAYPSHNGLVTISSSGAQVVTGAMITRDQWLRMNPYSFIAGQYSGRYMASYAYTEADGDSQRGMISIDLSGATPFLVRYADYADATYYDIETGALYLLKDQQKIFEWDAADQPYGEMTWRSKKFVLPTYSNFGAILIEGDDISSKGQLAAQAEKNRDMRQANQALIDADGADGELAGLEVGKIPFAGTMLADVSDYVPALGVTIVADGKAVAYVDKMNDVARLPAGFLAKTWEVIVRGNVQVTAIAMAASPSEIARG